MKNRRNNDRDLAALDPDNARALITVTGGRTVYELRGISCLPLELMEPTRKGIAVTRSLGLRSQPGARCARPSRATPHEQQRRCGATRWPPKTSPSSYTRTTLTMTRSTRMEPRHVRRDDQRHRGSGRPGRAPRRKALARRLPLLKDRNHDYRVAARNHPAARPLGRPRPREKGTGLESDGQAQRDPRARYPSASSVPVPGMPPGSSGKGMGRHNGQRGGTNCHGCGQTDKTINVYLFVLMVG